MIRSLEVLCHLDPRFGGVAVTVPTLAHALQSTDKVQARVLGFIEKNERLDHNGTSVETMPLGLWAWTDRRRWDILNESIQTADVVHVHGLWHPLLLQVIRVARALDRRVVVSPHGMLDPWALAHRRWKKQLVSAVAQRRLLAHVDCVRALTRQEAECVRDYGGSRQIAIIPNGISEPPGKPALILPKCLKELHGRPIVLFLGRIHRKKGIQLLLEAWPSLLSAVPNATLVLAGPDEEHLMRNLPLPPNCIWVGPVSADERWTLLSSADAFVLPSYSEGFSIAVLEALSVGLRTVITEQCNFPEVAQHQAGWVIQPKRDQLVSALTEALTQPPDKRVASERQARKLATSYAQGSIALEMANLYHALVSNGSN